jgi:hypothetical protein
MFTGLQAAFENFVSSLIIAPPVPGFCPGGVTLGEESGETFSGEVERRSRL